jgi:hypothetical protein
MTVGNRLLNYYAAIRPGAAPTPVYASAPVQPANVQPQFAATTYQPSTYTPAPVQPTFYPQQQVQGQYAQAMAALQQRIAQTQQALGQAVNQGQAQIASITQPQHRAYYPQHQQRQFYPQSQPPQYYPQNADMQRLQAQLNQTANQGAQVVSQLATSIQGIANTFNGGQQPQPYPYYR